MLIIDQEITARDVAPLLPRFWELSAEKLRSLHAAWNPDQGSPVFTAAGKYTSRGWTDWTLGFFFGSDLLQFEGTGDTRALDAGREGIFRHLPPHLTHHGVHDHGFNTVSTFGNLLRLMRAGKAPENPADRALCELAVKVSGAVQAARWTSLGGNRGFIHSFNGPHSLFADTIRTLRVLGLAHLLGHHLSGEQDERIDLLHALIRHGETTAEYTVFHGKGRDIYDVRGRVAHESIFNTANGSYRSPGTQQGYSPFTTWMRGLAWIILGFAEELEFLSGRGEEEFEKSLPKEEVLARFLRAATAASDFYCANVPSDGIPYWDSGAPGLARMPGALDRPADPFNDFEPVDSSAAAIAAQGLLRLGGYLSGHVSPERGDSCTRAGLTVARSLFAAPYLSEEPAHQGLLLHAVYHRPAGWDYVPPGAAVPRGESCLWGDYHARELAVMIQCMAAGSARPRFFDI